jgi:inosine/xanthosine triphosphatase
MSDEETKQGAIHRSKLAYQAYVDQTAGSLPSYSVGLEGGIAVDPLSQTMECFAWICVFDGQKVGSARTASFALPDRIKELVLGGLELGLADDRVFGNVNSKQKGGTVGQLSLGVIDRTLYYEHAVILAMVPFHWPELY